MQYLILTKNQKFSLIIRKIPVKNLTLKARNITQFAATITQEQQTKKSPRNILRASSHQKHSHAGISQPPKCMD